MYLKTWDTSFYLLYSNSTESYSEYTKILGPSLTRCPNATTEEGRGEAELG